MSPKQRNTEREAAMISAYGSGLLLKQVGEQFGVSRERVRQVLKRAGCTKRHNIRDRIDFNELAADHKHFQSRETSCAAICKKHGISKTSYRIIATERGWSMERDPVTHRRCSRCRGTFPLTREYFTTQGGDSFNCYCKPCAAELAIEYRHAHPDYVKRCQQWQKDNIDKQRKYQHEYHRRKASVRRAGA